MGSGIPIISNVSLIALCDTESNAFAMSMDAVYRGLWFLEWNLSSRSRRKTLSEHPSVGLKALCLWSNFKRFDILVASTL
ncbi:hypothetical protein PUN28_020671 [Cardiocondyla obscurior]|uniref:Uncharacterized protein n=1 Tax=Cardiocondyla obscurior TaxID=286306 RepID=A0AAW2E8Y5_9HYME